MANLTSRLSGLHFLFLLSLTSKAIDVSLVRDCRGYPWDQIVFLTISTLENSVDSESLYNEVVGATHTLG